MPETIAVGLKHAGVDGARRVAQEGRQLPSADLLAAGKALRDKIPRQDHGTWKRDKKAVDALAILQASDQGRVDHLLPIRYGRMLQSPFTFYRGAASVMAADLATTPGTGIRVQACGGPLRHSPAICARVHQGDGLLKAERGGGDQFDVFTRSTVKTPVVA